MKHLPYNPPIKLRAEQLFPGRVFLHRLQTYVRCTKPEEVKHPAHGETGVLAYHVSDRQERTPVRFRDDEPVYPARIVGGVPTLMHRRTR